MRQLWSTGWMHNRIRVVCASFLVKNLLLPWQWGLKHYWDALLDADLECDALGWQYVSGCLAGAPARPARAARVALPHHPQRSFPLAPEEAPAKQLPPGSWKKLLRTSEGATRPGLNSSFSTGRWHAPMPLHVVDEYACGQLLRGRNVTRSLSSASAMAV
jgi:hypothetical protein